MQHAAQPDRHSMSGLCRLARTPQSSPCHSPHRFPQTVKLSVSFHTDTPAFNRGCGFAVVSPKSMTSSSWAAVTLVPKPRWPARAHWVAALLLTHNIETLGQMSCNPSIGGIGKGHLVKEVDALRRAMAIATDESGIQFRILNGLERPGVRATAPRLTACCTRPPSATVLETSPTLEIFQQGVDDLIVEGDRVCGAVTQIGIRFRARAVVLTAGTFLDGRIHVGLENHAGGRRRPAFGVTVGPAEGIEAAPRAA